MLLQSRIDVNQKNMLGMSAFLLAAGYGNERLVHMILHAGADPKATNDFGNNAIHIAVVGKQVLYLILKTCCLRSRITRFKEIKKKEIKLTAYKTQYTVY